MKKKYGIKVKPWRAGSEAVLQRVLTEARAGKYEVDIIQNNAPEAEASHREKLLQAVYSPYLSDLIPEARSSHDEWVAVTFDVWTAAYNTKKVAKEDLPKSYADLQDPKWKGKLGVEANDQAWFAVLLSSMGQEKGSAIFKNIVKNNGMSVRKGHSLLTKLVGAGEVPIGLSVYNWNPHQLKQKGAPIESLLLEPLIAQPSTIALTKNAKHPAAALLFYDFVITDGQKMFDSWFYVAASKKYPHDLLKKSIKFVDPNVALDMQDKWNKQFDEIMVKGGQ